MNLPIINEESHKFCMQDPHGWATTRKRQIAAMLKPGEEVNSVVELIQTELVPRIGMDAALQFANMMYNREFGSPIAE
jgi:hypothetical protein